MYDPISEFFLQYLGIGLWFIVGAALFAAAWIIYRVGAIIDKDRNEH